jgi:hypothetical protein
MIPGLLHELVDDLRCVSADIDADVGHGMYRERVNACCLGPGAGDLESISRQRAQKALGHLAAGRIVRAEKEDSLLVHAALPM